MLHSPISRYMHSAMLLLVMLQICCTTLACSIEQDIDFNGNDLQPVTKRDAANATECCNLCTTTAGCTAWSLQQAKSCASKHNCCYLKSSAAGRRKYPGTISGTNPAATECSSAMDCSLGGSGFSPAGTEASETSSA